MKFDRNTTLVLVTCVAIGYWLAGPPDKPVTPLADRPVLRWIVKTAKTLLWVAVFVEPPPPEAEARHLVKAPAIGDDGYTVVDHGKGW